MVRLIDELEATIARVPVDGCPDVVGPEPGVEPVPDQGPGEGSDVVEPVDGSVDPLPPAEVTPGGPISPEVRRETSLSVRTFDGQGCMSGGSGGEGGTLLLLGWLLWLARRRVLSADA